MDTCEVRWLYDYRHQKAQNLIDEFGGGRVATKFEDIVHDPQVDVVSIASFDDDHFAQTHMALEAGKHVFVEKPLCTTMNELRALKHAWSKHPFNNAVTNEEVSVEP